MDKKEFSIFYGVLYKKPNTKSTINEINAKLGVINSMHSHEETKMDNIRKLALRTQKEEDLLELSKKQDIFDTFSKSCEIQIELLVVKIQEIEEYIKANSCPANNTRSKKAEPRSEPLPTIAKSARPRVTFTDVKDKFIAFSISLFAFYSTFCDSKKEDFHLATETVVIKGKKITINTSDVRGDGACGFRAILTSYLNTLGISLTYDPLCMENYILKLKECMYELLLILSENCENRDFINCLLSNPALGIKVANITEWFEKIKQNVYHCTDGDIRIIAILFGMLPENDKITQINVLKLKPVEHNPYQSFNSYGTSLIVLPCSESHINIIHTGGHYRSVSNFAGNLLQIESIDAVITLPNE